jgi:hypothetical protein
MVSEASVMVRAAPMNALGRRCRLLSTLAAGGMGGRVPPGEDTSLDRWALKFLPLSAECAVGWRASGFVWRRRQSRGVYLLERPFGFVTLRQHDNLPGVA